MRTGWVGIGTALLCLVSAQAFAVEPFGFHFGMSKAAVEKAATDRHLGDARWFGRTLIVHATDDPMHTYVFNFCADSLYEVAQQYPWNFDHMEKAVNALIRDHGQPFQVSAERPKQSDAGTPPLTLVWRIEGISFAKVVQEPATYEIAYQTHNKCVWVPR